MILGGTKFLGRAVVDAARARGHELTLFTRGETNPELYPDVEKVRGEPVYLILATTGDKLLRFKPQNLVTGLPVRHLEAVI